MNTLDVTILTRAAARLSLHSATMFVPVLAACLVLLSGLALQADEARDAAAQEKPEAIRAESPKSVDGLPRNSKPYPKTVHLVKMRDGRTLATDVCLPEGEGPWPVWFMRGPYGKNGYTFLFGGMSAAKGIVFISQDMRGRFESPGNDSVVFYNDGTGEIRDGHDTLKWIADQPWCNGKIAMFGGSALGITQCLLAPDAPDELKAIWVRWGISDFYRQCAYQGGVFRKILLAGWLSGINADPETLEQYAAHDKDGPFWEGIQPEKQAHLVNCAAVFHGGWFDIFNQGTIDCFVAFHNRGGPGARGKCRLVMGPYAHGQLVEIQYPRNARAPGFARQPGYKPPVSFDPLTFYEHVWNGTDNGVAEDRAVHYYVMGDPEDPTAPGNFWRAADNWPPPSTPTKLYLNRHGTLTWDAPKNSLLRRSYDYDPRDPVPTIGGMNMIIDRGPMDQRSIESRDDMLVFTTEELTESIEITGRISAKLFISSDSPDTDFSVRLCDVYPDGRSMIMNDGILRARFHKGFTEYNFLEQGKVYPLDIDLWSTSLIFNKGHRIRIDITSSNDPRFDPNPNTGKGRPLEEGGETRVALNTVHFSKEYPSHVILPVYAGPTDTDPPVGHWQVVDAELAREEEGKIAAGKKAAAKPNEKKLQAEKSD